MASENKVWRCGKFELKFNRPRIMGVLNVTPDSFSDGGEHLDTNAAIAHGLKMLDEGADIIDVGGESTRPGFTPVSPDVEAKRVLPVVRELAKRGAIVSIDTRHVDVAKAAVRVGASIVNDVSGFTDPRMVEFVKNNKCGLIVMHAGDALVQEEPPRHHTAVQLDTSAAAYVAERARTAAMAGSEGEATGRLGRPRRLAGGAVQPPLPFADGPAGGASTSSAAVTTDKQSVANTEESKKSPEQMSAEIELSANAMLKESVPQTTEGVVAIMARASRRDAATGATSQFRRFTLPDSAPIMRRVMGFLSDQARTLVQAGIERNRICLDPGPGFGKDANEDIVIQRETAKLASLGYPIMCAVSRKRFVGAVTGIGDAADRDAATFGVCLGAIQLGANIVRVHNVAKFSQFLNGFWAIARPQPRRAFVALGSNMGPRVDNIRAAKQLIAEIPMTCVSSCSRIYESEPAYEMRQEPFANAVIEIKTELAPLILLDELLRIEDKLGRNRTKSARPNGPRVIDCDLLWMDGEVHGGNKLQLPHPGLGERDFVLVPLEDLMHNPARFFRFEGIDVKEPEERFGHVIGELGEL